MLTVSERLLNLALLLLALLAFELTISTKPALGLERAFRHLHDAATVPSGRDART